MFKRGEYVGDDPMLREHKAMLKSEDWTQDTVMAQFDTVRGPNGSTLTTGDLDPSETPAGVARYMFGWHQFAKSDFRIEEDRPIEPDRDPGYPMRPRPILGKRDNY